MGVKTHYWLFQHQRHSNCTVSTKPTKQILIGYMMEYLREKEGMIILRVGGRASIKDVYEGYDKDIEKVERENLLERMVSDG